MKATVPADRVDSPGERRSRLVVSPRLVSAIFLIVVGVQVVIFMNYWSGSMTPPWDFYGAYGTDAFTWWTDGSFFHPAPWVPYAYGGFPSSLDWQNSSWYLPVGLASAISDYGPHTAAIVSALHVALGGVGIAVLCRQWRLRTPAILFATLAWSFASGFYANAEHVDIARGWGWAPWFLALISPGWPWRRWWAAPIAALIFWQMICGVYPGVLIASAYIGVIWLIVGFRRNPGQLKQAMTGLALSAGGALLLSAPKLVPVALGRSYLPSHVPDTSALSWPSLGTTIYGYSNDGLPGDVSVRSFFLPVTVFALLVLWRVRGRLNLVVAFAFVGAVGLGLPWPWKHLVADLPALSISRFRMSDFKVYMSLCLVVGAAASMSRILEENAAIGRSPKIAPDAIRARDGRSATLPRNVLVAAGVMVAAAVAFALSGLFSVLTILTGFCLLVVSLLVVLALPTRVQDHRLAAVQTNRLVSLFLVLTFVSGASWALEYTRPWQVARASGEVETFGAPVSTLIKHRLSTSGTQRPARTSLPPNASLDVIESGTFNSGFYSGIGSVGGYVNLKGSPTQAVIERGLSNPASSSALNAFIAAPGLVIATPPDRPASTADLSACVASLPANLPPGGTVPGIEDRRCGDATVKPNGFSIGRYSYDIASGSPERLLLNEAFYPGWTATLCATSCHAVPVTAGTFDLLQADVPAGSWVLTFTYRTPGAAAGWWLFACGIVLVLAMGLIRARGISGRASRAPAHTA